MNEYAGCASGCAGSYHSDTSGRMLVMCLIEESTSVRTTTLLVRGLCLSHRA